MVKYTHNESVYRSLLQPFISAAQVSYENWVASYKPHYTDIVTCDLAGYKKQRQIRKYNKKLQKYKGLLRKYPHWTTVPEILYDYQCKTKVIRDAREASVALHNYFLKCSAN